MKAWTLACCVVLPLLLSGCGGGEEEEQSETDRLAGVAEPSPTEPVSDEPDVEPFDEEVSISVSATLRSDRRMMVEGETNLPEDALLQVVVERELSGVKWRERIDVEEGRFSAGPFGPGSGLPDGRYTVTVSLHAADVQPDSVQARIGEAGEHLSGPLVHGSRHGLGQVATYSRRFLIGSEPRRTTDRTQVREAD